jgi:hypothetical protein
MGDPQNDWVYNAMNNPTKMDDLGVPPFQETSRHLGHVASA